MSRRFLLWDHDGVLVDTERWYFEATRTVLRRLQIDLSEPQYLEFMAAGRTPGSPLPIQADRGLRRNAGADRASPSAARASTLCHLSPSHRLCYQRAVQRLPDYADRPNGVGPSGHDLLLGDRFWQAMFWYYVPIKFLRVVENTPRLMAAAASRAPLVQSDGRIRKWGRITETGKVLRVILLKDGETVHNAFFDRSFREGET